MKKQFRDAISDCIHELKGDFYHGEYKAVYFFEDQTEQVGDRERSAEISTDPVYLNFSVTIFGSVYRDWKDKRYKRILRTLVHEICHILTEPLYRFPLDYISEVDNKYLMKVRERQTERIANIAYDAIDEKKYIKILKNEKAR